MGNIVSNIAQGKTETCEIKGWGNKQLKGGGEISLTSDKIGLLISSENEYLQMEDIINCKGNFIPLKRLSYFEFEDDIPTPVDVNLGKKLVLAIVAY